MHFFEKRCLHRKNTPLYSAPRRQGLKSLGGNGPSQRAKFLEITRCVSFQLFDIVNMGRETWTALRCDADLVIGCNTLIVNCFY